MVNQLNLAVNLEAGVQRSGTMMWADDIYNYQGITPTFAQNFNETVPWEGRTDTLISRFVHPIYTTNFRTLYNEEPDHFIISCMIIQLFHEFFYYKNITSKIPALRDQITWLKFLIFLIDSRC
ncbi:uncharacterized protein LOC126877375 [Bombus huntii]|uniref:uncharacterized protein LOC126877113 n=1 Tax=Bombus huntii TaxID=85661 RepID=UPI0021A98656|nr:uncharacterized protein LOC126877113 [Bombus huntii]XP_050495906.1 uncharacterized protein LOC126877113 [Bombus huntii]XP_050496128.1 uncharacterized protein LOC126877375 [Bombus huntii]XP_050496129.1 uncharacterized protein LOC126877375 [Bombus huntii]